MIATSSEGFSLSRSLFEPETGDPWRDLLQPALFDLGDLVDQRLSKLPLQVSSSGVGKVQAVGARALYALGRPVQARHLLDQALRTGAREALTLEAVVGCESSEVVASLVSSGSVGERVDGACDGVLAALRAGESWLATRWLNLARELCPEHAEAERWQAYLDLAGDQASPLVWSVDRRGEEIELVLEAGRARDPLLGHLADLLPRAWEGHLSRERMLRRHRSLKRGRRATPGSGLMRLHQAGRVGRWLDRDRSYDELPGDHPRVRVEIALDRARACQDEGRSAWSPAAECWQLAPALGLFSRARLVQLLALLALRDPGLSAIADHATEMVLDELPRDPDLLGARAAALVTTGQVAVAVSLAEQALKSLGGSDLGLVLAVETLRRTGAVRAVQRELRRRLEHPEYGWLADVWLMDLDLPPLSDDIWELPDRSWG